MEGSMLVNLDTVDAPWEVVGTKSSLRATRICARLWRFDFPRPQTDFDEAPTGVSGAPSASDGFRPTQNTARPVLIGPNMTREALIELLQNSDGHVTRAATAAGIERQSLHRLLKRHGIEPSHYRPRGGRGLVARAALFQLRRTTMQRALGGDAAITDSSTIR
jgi:hypothetical protein